VAWIGTVPHARGRGIAKLITAAAVRTAMAHGRAAIDPTVNAKATIIHVTPARPPSQSLRDHNAVEAARRPSAGVLCACRQREVAPLSSFANCCFAWRCGPAVQPQQNVRLETADTAPVSAWTGELAYNKHSELSAMRKRRRRISTVLVPRSSAWAKRGRTH
jgi:hypothetical protein